MYNHLLKHIGHAAQLLDAYNGDEPLHLFLKKYFAANKKHGSKDRKSITHCCYTYFRIGNNLKTLPIEEKIKAALFVCDGVTDKNEALFLNDWTNDKGLNIAERIRFIQNKYTDFSLDKIFPYSNQLSQEVDTDYFLPSILQQPLLFLRIRPGMNNVVLEKLHQAEISFTQLDNSSIALNNNTKVDTIVAINKEVVIQDYSSQQVGQLMEIAKEHLPKNKKIKVWDACAASGGKSILATDLLQRIQLTVSDIRKNIIQNLKQRFKEAGIDQYHSFIADLSKPTNFNQKFDFIICDVPCSGSGTWARTPENIPFFKEEEIEKHQTLQRNIIANSLPHLNDGGCFLYITCSVFSKENEENMQYIETNYPLKCIKMVLLKGYAHRADCMYAALFSTKK